MQHQVESWRQTQITDAQAKLIFYSAFVDGKLSAVLRAGIPGVLAANDVELVERLHQRVQRSQSTFRSSSHGQAGRISEPAAGLIETGSRSRPLLANGNI